MKKKKIKIIDYKFKVSAREPISIGGIFRIEDKPIGKIIHVEKLEDDWQELTIRGENDIIMDAYLKMVSQSFNDPHVQVEKKDEVDDLIDKAKEI